MTAKLTTKSRLNAIKRVKSGEKISKVCKELGISRTIFYRWLKRYKQNKNKFSALIPRGSLPKNWEPYQKLSPKNRLLVIERVNHGESVAKICQLYGVSRPVFYKWFTRYNEAPEGQKLEALWDKKPRVEKYFNQAPEEYEEAVLDAVRKYPELSSHKLVWVLPQVGERPILGNHGVQNILRRHSLTLYEQRLAYAQAYQRPTPFTRFFGVFQTALSFVGSRQPAARSFIIKAALSFFLTLFALTASLGAASFSRLVFQTENFVMSLGMIFSLLSLSIGTFFFLYSLKYYLTIAIVLSFSRQVGGGYEKEEGKGSFFDRLFGNITNGNGNGRDVAASKKYAGGGPARNATHSVAGGGLQPDLSDVQLSRKPFVSIHLATYNEKKVIDRLLTAATSQNYESYEVVIVDDSTDETTEIAKQVLRVNYGELRFMRDNEGNEVYKTPLINPSRPSLTLIHRTSREGFKGGALRVACEQMSSKAEFVLVFDADFIPYPDTITQFLKYFQAVGGTLDFRNSKHQILNSKQIENSNVQNSKQFRISDLDISASRSNIAAVQGYQWHILNKSENWITRGVRSEYAGSYVIERSGTEIYSGLKQIAGSVYMIRADVLKEIGWGTSITEDFQLTLKLYEKGYKVVYTPYIQAPAEAVSTIKRLIRQRMRWAEGHSHNIRKMFLRLLKSPKLTLTEKLEFLYLSPYYLQAFLFMLGTFSWFLAEAVFRVKLPFWTEIWGWSLVLTNLLALPLLNTVGLFLEESEEKDYLGLFSFIALSYIVAPFQGYAALKGFLAKEEGPWFRTPKTGRITDIFTPGRFYRYIFGIFGRPSVVHANQMQIADIRMYSNNFNSPVLALNTANNRFNTFHIKPKRMKWLAKTFLVILLILSMNLSWLSFKVPLVHASPGTQIKTIEMPIYQYAANADDTDIAASGGIKSGTYAASHDTGQYTSQVFYNSLPYIAYYDVTMGDLKFIKCGDSACSSGNTITTVDGALVKDGSVETNVGYYNSLQVINGTPYISYADGTNTDLKFVKCGNDTCSSGNTITIIDTAGDMRSSLQVISGTPNTIYIAYIDEVNTALKFVKCQGDDTCSSGKTTSTVDSTIGDYPGGDYSLSLQVISGIPYISYYDYTNTALKFVKCGDDTCDNNPANTISTVDNTQDDGQYSSLQVVSSIPYISYYDATNTALKFVKCGDDTCDNNPANTISTVDNSDASGDGEYTSLQVVSGIPYVSYRGAGALKFVKCGDDTCDNSPLNTISLVQGGSTSPGQYTSLQMISGIPYISHYHSVSVLDLGFVKCGDDTCDNSPANTFSTASTGGFGAGFHLDIPETGTVTVRYAYVEWRTILKAADATTGNWKFAREEDTAGGTSTGALNTNSAEDQPVVMRFDVTSKIAQGFATYSFDVQIDIARNTDSAKLVVTYEYDDAAATQVKTVRYALDTQATQGASNDCGPDVSINPNIQEAGISIQKAWVEINGQVSAGAADTGTGVYFQDGSCFVGRGQALGTGGTNNTMMDGDAKTTYDFVAMYEPAKVVASGATAGQLNYNASNTISPYNTAQVMNLKGGELVITYNYSYYNTSNTTHRNTVRYFVGQRSGALPIPPYGPLGAPVVYLPESSLSNYNAYLKIVGTNVAAAATRYRVTITGGSAVEYPSASTYYDTVVSEQAGRNVIFIDISNNFNTNWSSGDTVTVEVQADTANETYAVGAELIISYNFVIPVGSGTFTNIKTVNWYIGQETVKGTAAYSPSFNTYIPETSTTKRSSGAMGDYVVSDTGSTNMILAIGGTSTTTTYANTGENVTLSAFHAAGALTNVSQTGVTSSFDVTTGSTNGDLKGGIAYTTYEVSAPQAPEKALFLILIAPFLPRIIEWWRRRRLKPDLKLISAINFQFLIHNFHSIFNYSIGKLKSSFTCISAVKK